MFNLPQIPSIAMPKFGAGVSADASRIMKLAAPVGAISVSVVIFLFIVWPKFNEVLRLRSSNSQLEARSVSLAEKSTVLASLDRDQLDVQLGSAEALLPSDKGVFLLVAQIERAASLAGVILNKVDVTPGAVGQITSDAKSGAAAAQPAAGATANTGAADLGGATFDTAKIQLKVSITSDYSAFLRFLTSIAILPRVVSISDLTLSSASTGSETSAVRTLLTIDAYWSPIPSELPSVETPVEKLTESEEQRLGSVRSAEATGGGAVSLPSVPTGKPDLFAPF